MAPTDTTAQTLTGHLDELRIRVMRALAAVGMGTVVGMIFSKPIYHWLARPMLQVLDGNSFFIATDPIEAFMTYVRTGFVAGLFLAIPVLIYEVWGFVAPALYSAEKKRTLLFVILTSCFFMGGALFGYFVVFPTSFSFFNNMLGGSGIKLLPRMSEYFSFAARLLFAFGLVFELPVLMLILARMGLVTASQLRRIRPYTLVGIFIISGLMTGPDLASQFLMAVPLLVLFEVGVVLAHLLGKKSEFTATQ